METPESVERRIQYATSADGTSIAYWTLGDGEPLVYMAGGPWSHIELWHVPECRRWYERLAERRMLVRYDVRGTGLSQRNVGDFSLAAQVEDLGAVVDRLALDRFDLLAAADAGAVAVRYVADHPERVSRLALWCAWVRGTDLEASPRIQAWRGLIDEDWQLMTETCAQLALGWSAGEVGRQAAQTLRDNVTKDTAKAALNAMGQFDAEAALPDVKVPTFVMHRKDIAWLPQDIALHVASRLPHGRLSLFDGESTAPYIGDAEAVASAIEAFLDEEAPVPQHDRGASPTARAEVAEAKPAELSEREVEVLGLLAAGRTNQEIADELVLSVRTVERHVQNVYGKIGARRRAEATAYALTRGIV